MSKLRITRKTLLDWAGAEIVRDAEALVRKEAVLEAEFEPPLLKGVILWNNRPLDTSLEILEDGKAENRCPCYTNRERGLICAHVIALGLTVVQRATDPLRAAKSRAERRRAARMAGIDEGDYITRVSGDVSGAIPAKLELVFPHDWQDRYERSGVPIVCRVRFRNHAVLLDEVRTDLPLTFSRRDESLLYVLEDISEGPPGPEVRVGPADLINIISLVRGAQIDVENGEPITVGETPLKTNLRMDLDHENGELILVAHTELPFLAQGEHPFYLVSGHSGWAYGAGHLWPLEHVLPTPYHAIYTQPVIVPRDNVIRFLRRELPEVGKHLSVESDISLDLFTVEPAPPRFRLKVCGSLASLSATLYAEYNDNRVIVGKPASNDHFSIADPDDLLRYMVRNPSAESEALQILRGTGVGGECGDDLTSLVGRRDVLNFLGSHVPALRRLGWRVELEGRVAPVFEEARFVTPVVQIGEDTGGWFDVSFDFEDHAGASISHNQIQRAMAKGESYLESEGSFVLIDSEAIDSMMGVFSDCDSSEAATAGHFRMGNVYAPYVKSSLDALDGIDVEATPDWVKSSSRQNRAMSVEPVVLPAHLDGVLRGYQKDGVAWLRFLEANGFSGILADEMGLGKTLQTLAWLQLKRTNKEARDLPSLIVCPTSLVENWAEEAARFAPSLRVQMMSGPDRHEQWDTLSDKDMVITSYALLRRDLDRYLEFKFAAGILDEAQHIKNRSTQNALSAKQIPAVHRLVLTGTPIENGVSDIWSIMDFLMPGYLGHHEAFRTRYELPIAKNTPDSAIAQGRLRRKLHPFLLRRLKREVARDLPAKIQRVAMCDLTADQKVVYQEILRKSRQTIQNLVSTKGFNRARMEILTALMRLRQTCCHLDLLKMDDLKADRPSSKLELFFELMNEALDSGHRVLVFSQFVSMLRILRTELESRELKLCYLDGSTKNRLEIVHRFNTQRDIPVFLISLKAGGTGLNLTGADMVIHFDPWWNPAVEDQATDRAYRIGQKRTVYSIKLLTRGTVEEKVRALQDRKRAIIDGTLSTDDPIAQSLTWDDVQDLLQL